MAAGFRTWMGWLFGGEGAAGTPAVTPEADIRPVRGMSDSTATMRNGAADPATVVLHVGVGTVEQSANIKTPRV